MDILLVAPSVDTCYEHAPSIGLMNLYLIGKDLGCNIELLDLTTYSYSRGLEKILAKKYDTIGISCNFVNAAPYCMRYAKDIKEKYPRTLVVAGGNHATLVPEDFLFNAYDYVIYGEGEVTFGEFLKRTLRGESLTTLKGVCYLRGHEIVKNPARELIENLDTLPFNNYSEFDLESYFKKSGARYLAIETSRGCVYNCAFCSTVKMWGHQYRSKTPQRILEEFKIADGLNLDFLFIEDDDTAFDENNLRNFCRLLIDNEIKISWGMGTGSASIKDESTFDLLAESGCVKVNVCIESANPRILKAYRKPHRVEDDLETCFNLRKRGIIAHNHGIIGYPDEKISESLRTYCHLIKTSPIWHVSTLEPRPGSDYWEEWRKNNDWSKYRLFGKANIFLGKRKFILYFVYRIFAFFYFLNPARIFRALFASNKGIRYSYRVQYRVAWKTLKENFLFFLSYSKK